MVTSKLKSDLKKLTQLKSSEELKKQLGGYEKQVLEVVREIELKTKNARKLGKVRIAEFKKQVREQRSWIEKQVKQLATKEHKRLSNNINDLLSHLRKLSGTEAKKTTATKKATPSKKSGVAKKSATRVSTARKKTPQTTPVTTN